MADAVNVKKMKVAELKKELLEHGLTTKGNKRDLQARLEEFLQQQGVELHQGEELEIDEELDHDGADDDDMGDDDIGDSLADEGLVKDTAEDKVAEESLALVHVDQEKELISEDTQNNGEVQSPSKLTADSNILLAKSSSDEERKLQRVKKFGGPASDKDKKLARAERFGGAVTTSTKSTTSAKGADSGVKLKKRAERFGAVSPAVVKVEEQERIRKRKERFGVLTVTAASDPIEIKKKKRAERFGV